MYVTPYYILPTFTASSADDNVTQRRCVLLSIIGCLYHVRDRSARRSLLKSNVRTVSRINLDPRSTEEMLDTVLHCWHLILINTEVWGTLLAKHGACTGEQGRTGVLSHRKISPPKQRHFSSVRMICSIVLCNVLQSLPLNPLWFIQLSHPSTETWHLRAKTRTHSLFLVLRQRRHLYGGMLLFSIPRLAGQGDYSAPGRCHLRQVLYRRAQALQRQQLDGTHDFQNRVTVLHGCRAQDGEVGGVGVDLQRAGKIAP